jgi:hypothetical protein
LSNPAVNTERMNIALGKIQGFPFEAFVNDFFGALLGKSFAPLKTQYPAVHRGFFALELVVAGQAAWVTVAARGAAVSGARMLSL